MKKFLMIILCLMFMVGCVNVKESDHLSQGVTDSSTDVIDSTSKETSEVPPAYYSQGEIRFSSTLELQNYLIEKGLIEKDRVLPDIVSPYDGSEMQVLYLHGSWIYYYFDPGSRNEDDLLTISYTYQGSGKESLAEWVKREPSQVKLYPDTEHIYYTDVRSFENYQTVTCYRYYWEYDDIFFRSTSPLDKRDTVLDNILNNRYLRENAFPKENENESTSSNEAENATTDSDEKSDCSTIETNSVNEEIVYEESTLERKNLSAYNENAIEAIQDLDMYRSLRSSLVIYSITKHTIWCM